MSATVLEGRTREELLELARGYHWWHAIDLGGLVTSGTRSPLIAAAFDQLDFKDKKVLDIGCWDGLWSFEAEQRGASEVYSVDYVSLRSWSEQPTYQLAHRVLGSKARYYPNLSVYEIERVGVRDFDLVIYCGIYYHLLEPLRAFTALRAVMKEGAAILVEGPAVGDLEKPFANFHGRQWFGGDPTNWWVPSVPCLREWLDCTFFDVTREISVKRHLAPTIAASPAAPARTGLLRSLFGGPPAGPPAPAADEVDRVALIARSTSVSGRLARELERHAVPPLMGVAGMTAPALAGLCDAARRFEGQRPWRHVRDDVSVKVDGPLLKAPVFATVLGHRGQHPGLVVYFDRGLLTMTLQGSLYGEQITWAAFLALLFSDKARLPAGEAAALEEVGWPAGSARYPYALFSQGGTNPRDPGNTLRRPQPGELQLLEGCLGALPAFVEKHPPSQPVEEELTVGVSSGEIRLTLSWVTEGARDL